jgi:hypothetical protein
MDSHIGRCRVAGLTALLFVAFAATPAGAQTPPPAVYPITPDPKDCAVEPASLDGVITVLQTPVAAAAASPTPFAPPLSVPADAEVASDVVATLYEVFACANAGDPLRVSSLFTADFMRAFYGEASLEEVAGFLVTPPEPLPEEERRVIVAIGQVQMLPDGRAGVVIVLDEPDDPRTEEPDYAILERAVGRWLVDEIHEDGGAGMATPEA